MIMEREAMTYLGYSGTLRRAADQCGHASDKPAVAGKQSIRMARAEDQQQCFALKNASRFINKNVSTPLMHTTINNKKHGKALTTHSASP